MWSTLWDYVHKLTTVSRRSSPSRGLLLAILGLGSGALILGYFVSHPSVSILRWAVVVGTLLAGIGLLGTLTTTLVSSMASARSDGSRRLMRSSPYSGHFVLCGWNGKALRILEELRSDLRTAHTPVVLLADLPEKPPEVPYLVRGHVTPTTMQQANMAAARAVIILGDAHGDAFSSDARAVLITHTIKAAYPALYTCVELLDPQNLPHCQMARADEIIVSGAVASTLLARAARDPGVTRVVSDLLQGRQGPELYFTPVPSVVVGKPFLEALTRLKQDYNVLLIAVQSGEGMLYTNPPSTYQIRAVDRLYVIAADRPTFPR
jgi:voltage-gated potassium channel